MDKIIDLIYNNGTLTPEELSVMTGESVESVKAKLKEYKEKGVILGKRTIINWDNVEDGGVTAIIELKVTPQKETGFDEVAELIASYEEVDSVILMAADKHDLLITVRGKTIQDVAMFVAKRLSTIDAVQSTATHFQLKRYKENGIVFKSKEKDKRSIML